VAVMTLLSLATCEDWDVTTALPEQAKNKHTFIHTAPPSVLLSDSTQLPDAGVGTE